MSNTLHIAVAVDKSGSMSRHAGNVVRVVDQLIADAVQGGRDTGQEIRISLYFFGSQVERIAFDQPGHQVGTIRNSYRAHGNTRLIDAAIQVQQDLELVDESQGVHNFLLYVITDGQENFSNNSVSTLVRLMGRQGENWTSAILVPDVMGRIVAQRYGFAPGNIAVWDASSDRGFEDVGRMTGGSTQTYIRQSAAGVRGTRHLLTANYISEGQVSAAGLRPVDPDDFMIIPVALASTSTLTYKIPAKSKTRANPDGVKHVEIAPFIQETGRRYVVGNTFYKLTKSERWNNEKDVAIIHRVTRQVFRGAKAKELIGITANTTRIKPQKAVGGDYDIYLMSTSMNRHLEVGGSILLFRK